MRVPTPRFARGIRSATPARCQRGGPGAAGFAVHPKYRRLLHHLLLLLFSSSSPFSFIRVLPQNHSLVFRRLTSWRSAALCTPLLLAATWLLFHRQSCMVLFRACILSVRSPTHQNSSGEFSRRRPAGTPARMRKMFSSDLVVDGPGLKEVGLHCRYAWRASRYPELRSHLPSHHGPDAE